MKTLGPIYLCDKAPFKATCKSVNPGELCPWCKRPLDEHKTAAA